MFARTPEKGQIEQGITSLAYGLFVPIFFVNIGLSVDLRGLQLNAVWLILVVTLAAIAGKLLGAAQAPAWAAFPGTNSFQLGAGMVARGEVTLIVIAAAGSKAGLVDSGRFSAIVAAVLLTTLVTPPLLRFAFARFPKR